MTEFRELPLTKASAFANSNSAFRGDIADWFKDEISAAGTKVFLARLPPVKMHRKVGPFHAKTKLTFFSSAPQTTALRFKDISKPPTDCTLDELGDEAVILVVDPTQAGQNAISVRVNASGEGAIIDETDLAKNQQGKCVFVWHFKVIDPAGMVGWYDPGQLAKTAVDVAVSTIFGRNADYRTTEALATPPTEDRSERPQTEELVTPPAGDKSQPEQTGTLATPPAEGSQSDKTIDPLKGGFHVFDADSENNLWIDYVADTGDGWDSTYAVAYHVSKPELEIAGKKLTRGRILIFGGDEVYPTSSRPVYQQRLIDVYEAALPYTKPPHHPDVFAVPGNHDWYDSLVSFTRLFCQGRWFAGWKTRQTRSYFALKLTKGWWLIGTDVQLDSDLDFPQGKYFKGIADQMGPDDRVILCTAEPHWIYDKLLKKFDNQINENNLAFLEEKIFCRKIAVFLSGDLHHYRRHATQDNHQKITAGGGGAFLHPTHGGDVRELRNHYKLKTSFPSEKESSRLTWRNLGFPFINPSFGLLTAFLYTLTCWSVMADLSKFKTSEVWLASKAAISASIVNPTAVFWILAVWGGFLLFTDTHSKRFRVIAGSLHGFAHVLSTFFIGWFATAMSMKGPWHFREAEQLVVAGAIIFVLGWIVGSFVMGIYLTISLNIFKRHANETFSGLAIPDWKNFLRLKIDKTGQLTIYPIGIRRVPRKWKRSGKPDGPMFEPDDQKATAPHLIEDPIVIP